MKREEAERRAFAAEEYARDLLALESIADNLADRGPMRERLQPIADAWQVAADAFEEAGLETDSGRAQYLADVISRSIRIQDQMIEMYRRAELDPLDPQRRAG